MAFNTHWSMNPPLIAQAFMNMCTHAYMTKHKDADKETVMNNFKDMIEFSGLLAFEGKFFIAAVPGYSTNAWADLKSMVSTAKMLVCLITSRCPAKCKLKVYVMGKKACQVMNMVKGQAKHKFPSEVKVMKMSDPSFLYRIAPGSMITKSGMYKVMKVNEDLHVAMDAIMNKHGLTDMNENRGAYENTNVPILMPTNELMDYFMLENSYKELIQDFYTTTHPTKYLHEFKGACKSMGKNTFNNKPKDEPTEEDKVYDEFMGTIVGYRASLAEITSTIIAMNRGISKAEESLSYLAKVTDTFDHVIPNMIVESKTRVLTDEEANMLTAALNTSTLDRHAVMVSVDVIRLILCEQSLTSMNNTVKVVEGVVKQFSTFMSAAPRPCAWRRACP